MIDTPNGETGGANDSYIGLMNDSAAARRTVGLSAQFSLITGIVPACVGAALLGAGLEHAIGVRFVPGWLQLFAFIFVFYGFLLIVPMSIVSLFVALQALAEADRPGAAEWSACALSGFGAFGIALGWWMM